MTPSTKFMPCAILNPSTSIRHFYGNPVIQRIQRVPRSKNVCTQHTWQLLSYSCRFRHRDSFSPPTPTPRPSSASAEESAGKHRFKSTVATTTRPLKVTRRCATCRLPPPRTIRKLFSGRGTKIRSFRKTSGDCHISAFLF